MRSGITAFFIVSGFVLGVGEPVRANPLERQPGPSPQENHIRSIDPPELFSVDRRMQQNVDFWVRIYTQYTASQGLIHDAKYVDHVYETLDLTKIDNVSKYTRTAKRKWRDLLLSVHRKQKSPEKMTEEERKLYDAYQDVNEPNKFLNAAHRKRIRFQMGARELFIEGLKDSGRYLPIMEEIFKKEGLPVELTRLPFVESSFNIRARSKVGASGIWQFMRSTGRLFLKVNDVVDERNDPIRATEAAAKLLKTNYESLGKWPLAVTAYNHGRKGMMRAVRTVGSEELEDLVGTYRGRTFGFASSNFFTELLAAIEVEKNHEKYFGKIERYKPVPSIEVRIPDFVSFQELCQLLKLNREAVKSLNPGLAESVFDGERLIPRNYILRLPYDGGVTKEAAVGIFMAGYAQIPAAYKHQKQESRKYAKKRKRSR